MELERGGVNWGLFVDTMALVFSYFWLACGVVVVLAVAALLLTLYLRNRRRRPM